MKKAAVLVFAIVLALGCATPAFAAGPHHGAGRCVSAAGLCQGLMENGILPRLQSFQESIVPAIQRANAGANMGAGAGIAAQAGGTGSALAQNGAWADNAATAPGLCANGACAIYTDADGDGICDYHGSGYGSGVCGADVDGDGICDYHGSSCPNGYHGTGNGIGSGYGSGYGTGYGTGTHHGSHHGGYHH